LATDPVRGATGAKPVTALHLNRDTDLTDVHVVVVGGGARAPNGPAQRPGAGAVAATAVVQTTAHHPFWDAAAGRWTDAARLSPGESTLLGPDGTTYRVTAVRQHVGARWMHDLTVADTHTYYVLAGKTPVLVHNCETTDLHRVSPVERGSSELDNGLNPEHFPLTDELDGSAHFGNEARVNDFAANHGGTHGQGFRVTVPNKWLRDNDIEVWEGMTPDHLEYVIPNHLFDEFNQFPRAPWAPGAS
jgi:hypothetical protein